MGSKHQCCTRIRWTWTTHITMCIAQYYKCPRIKPKTRIRCCHSRISWKWEVNIIICITQQCYTRIRWMWTTQITVCIAQYCKCPRIKPKTRTQCCHSRISWKWQIHIIICITQQCYTRSGGHGRHTLLCALPSIINVHVLNPRLEHRKWQIHIIICITQQCYTRICWTWTTHITM